MRLSTVLDAYPISSTTKISTKSILIHVKLINLLIRLC